MAAIEIIEDNIAQRIIAMPFTRSDAEGKITALSEVVTTHIIKIILYRDSPYCNGWRKEIRTRLYLIEKYGNNFKKGRSLKQGDYRNFLSIFIEPIDSIVAMTDYVNQSMVGSELKPKRISPSALHTKMRSLYNSMCELLVTSPSLKDISTFVSTIK